MPLNLLTFDDHHPDPHWMYAHATLQRLFRSNPDGRQQFWPQVPGFKAAFSRANLVMDNFNGSDRLLAHFLVQLEDGWINILGGTEWPLGWPYHAFSLVEPPVLTPYEWFIGYWYTVGNNALTDIAAVIPANDSKPIVYSGHSLGGAASVAAGYIDFLRTPARPRTAVTFGCPLTRGKQGLDNRTFPICRVWNENDMVPSLPFHLIKVAITAGGLIKVPLFNLYHQGMGMMVSKDGAFEESNGGFFRHNALAAAFLLGAGVVNNWDPFTEHYIDSYAFFCRKACEAQDVEVLPFWDKVNAFINEAVGLEWEITGFPREPPPAPSITPPTPQNLGVILNAAPNFAAFNNDLLNPRPGVPLLRDQSLAGYLNAATGTAFEDVTIHLSQAPITDPLNVDLTSFTECDFSGYQFFGGPNWVQTLPQAWTPARRMAARAVFSCIGEERINTAYAWYAVGHKIGTGERVLLDWRQLGNPFTFDRPRTLCIEYSLGLGPA